MFSYVFPLKTVKDWFVMNFDLVLAQLIVLSRFRVHEHTCFSFFSFFHLIFFCDFCIHCLSIMYKLICRMCILVLSCAVKLNLKQTRLNLVRMRADEK